MPPRPIGNVPPDHPMFHGGVSFVFLSDSTRAGRSEHENDQSVDEQDED